MFDDQMIFIVCVAGAVALAGYFLSSVIFKNDDGKLRERLNTRQGPNATGRPVETGHRAKDLFQRIGSAAAKPFMSENREKVSEMRKKLSRAGIYTPASIRMVQGMKVICLGAGLIGGYVAGGMFENV